jgi:hypothetical protein
MSRVLDEMARVMASPMSRRQAVGRLWKVMAAGLAATVLAAPVAAQRGRQCETADDCPDSLQCCGGQCAPSQLVCCKTGDTAVACPEGHACCPESGCSASEGQCK